jgi:predicted Zn-dependent peptidase
MRGITKQNYALALASLVLCGSLSFAQSTTQIPAHPDQIKYLPLDYTPPEASSYRQVLNNGVVGFFVEDHDLPLTTLSVIIRVGTYLDPEGKGGLAAALGSQLRAGGTTTHKAEEFDEEAAFLAANISSFVGATSGGASVNFLSKDADKALQLFFDMLKNPAFQQDRLKLHKSQVLQQMERRNDRTGEWSRLMRGKNHFTTQWSTKASVSALTREDLISHHKKYFHPGNFIMAASGDFNTADLQAKLEAAMEGWESSGESVSAVPKPGYTPVAGVYMVNKPDVNQGRVSIGHLGIMRGNPDEYAIDMMNDILGGSGFTSRITNRVRSDEGLAYSAGSSFSAGVYYEGSFRAAFQTKNPTAARATQIVIEEIERIRNEEVAEEELDTVKNSAVEIFPRYFASAAAIAGTFANDEYTGRDPAFWKTYRDKIRAVKVEDIQRVAQKYLHPDRLVILVVGNVEEILKGDADKPEYSFQKIGAGKIERIPLPDPTTMVYPKN